MSGTQGSYEVDVEQVGEGYWWCAEKLVVGKNFQVVIMLKTEGRLKVVTLGRK